MSRLYSSLFLVVSSICVLEAVLPVRIYQPGDVILGCLISVREKETYDKCGKFFHPGISRAEAVIYAVNKINKDPTLLPNITVGYDIRDYCDSPALAMAHAYDFSLSVPLADCNDYQAGASNVHVRNGSRPIAALIGPSDSGTALPVTGLLRIKRIATISSSATSDELSGKLYSNFFRTIPPDIYQAKAMADLIEHFNWTYVGAVVVDHSYGRYGIRALEQESYDRKSFCIAITEFLPRSGFQTKLEHVISKLKSKTNIKVIVLWTTETLGKGFLDAVKQHGLVGRTWILSEALGTYKAEFLGPHLSPSDDYFAIQPKLSEDPGFTEHMRAMTPSKSLHSNNIWWEFVWREEFNCTAFNATGFERCNDDVIISQKLYDKLKSGFVPYQIDAFFAAAHAVDGIFRCNGGNCSQKTPFVQPVDVIEYLKRVNFTGVTGPVEFDENGDPVKALYEVATFQAIEHGQPSFIKRVPGTWTNSMTQRLYIDHSIIKWASGSTPISVCRRPCPAGERQTVTVRCCWECFECPEGYVKPFTGASNCTKCPRNQKSNANKSQCIELPIINQSWGSISVIIFLVFTIIGFLLTFFVMGVFWKYRETPLVKASNRELSFLLLLGIVLCFTLALFHLVLPNIVLCPVIEPWRYIVYTTCVSTLFLKTMRIVELFEANSNVRRCIKFYVLHNRRQIATLFLINTIEIILAVVWLYLDRPYLYEKISPGSHIFLLCRSYHDAKGKVVQALMLLYLTSLSLLCICYAFKGRNLPENFNEARYISFSMYILLLSWLAYYPVSFTLEGWPYEAVIACATTLLNSYGLLGCIFIPKVYIILRQPEKNTAEAVRANLRIARGMNNITGRSISQSSPSGC